MGEYDDIIDLPHHVSRNHRQMPMRNRAAQFAPFAALTGYDQCVSEAGRQTEQWTDVGESDKAQMDRTMMQIMASASEHPLVRITYFVPDQRKAGGRYVTVTGNIDRMRMETGDLLLQDGTSVPIRLIHDISLD